jgi:hypothetical protein
MPADGVVCRRAARPALVNYTREFQLDRGVVKADAQSITMHRLAGPLVPEFISNWAVTSVAEQLAAETKRADDTHQHPVDDVEVLAVEASHSGE